MNIHATTPRPEQVACMPSANAQTFQQLLLRCRVKVGQITYTALFPSTFDAVSDAQDRFPDAGRITARAEL